MVCLLGLAVAALVWSAEPVVSAVPTGFAHLDTVAPDVLVELRYATAQNFVGTRVDGYEGDRAILTLEAAAALAAVQADLAASGLRLKVFDAYRPQRAVLHFVRWARDQADVKTKPDYYPDVPKSELFERGYIALESGHSRGSTVDLTLCRQDAAGEWRALDMGTPFDFFGAAAASVTNLITPEQQANRRLLRAAMEKRGWIAYEAEWWHFTLRDEPYPETYFDFVVR